MSEEFIDQIEIGTRVLSSPDLYVAAIQQGRGPAHGQSLGEWVADTITDARRRMHMNVFAERASDTPDTQ